MYICIDFYRYFVYFLRKRIRDMQEKKYLAVATYHLAAATYYPAVATYYLAVATYYLATVSYI